MKHKSEPRVDRLQIDHRIRRILLLEIILVFTFYLILFIITNAFLIQQNKVTDYILSRFQMTVNVQNLGRLSLQYVNNVNNYRLKPTEESYEALVRNNSDFSDLLNKVKDRLDVLTPSEAGRLKEEQQISNKLLEDHQEMTAVSGALLGRPVLSPTAIHRQGAAAIATAAVANKTPEELDQRFQSLQKESVDTILEWRSLAEQDITRLKEKLVISQRLRTVAIVIQALFVILSLIIIGYTYVLPSFEGLFKQVMLQNEELIRNDSLKTEFLSIASHQLRTPLSVIKWSLSLFLKQSDAKLDDKQKEMLNQAKLSADTVIKLVSNLLNLSRIEQGRLHYHPQEADLVPLLQEIVKQSETQAAAKKVRVILDNKEKSIKVTVDPLLFKEVIQNLVDNAIAYNRPDGTVTLTTREKGGQWVIDVADTGYGIPPEDMKNLFTKFYRGTNARTIRPDGSGLGLYFIKKIVTRHGGKIGVESELNKGTMFSISWPIHAKPASKSESEEQKGIVLDGSHDLKASDYGKKEVTAPASTPANATPAQEIASHPMPAETGASTVPNSEPSRTTVTTPAQS